MWRLIKSTFFDFHDQAHFCRVFVPGAPKNIPTRRTFARFLRLVPA